MNMRISISLKTKTEIQSYKYLYIQNFKYQLFWKSVSLYAKHRNYPLCQ